jgi:hypothetical protein
VPGSAVTLGHVNCSDLCGSPGSKDIGGDIAFECTMLGLPSFAAPPSCPRTGIRRHTLHSSWLGCIEDFSASGDWPAPRGHSPEYQLVSPYAGAFEFHVGGKTVLVDATRVLFVVAGEDYADSHVGRAGHDSIIITPRLSILQELCGHDAPSRHPAFQRIAKPTTQRVNMRCHRMLRLKVSGNDPLAFDELMIALLSEALEKTPNVAGASPLRVVDRAKQFLHARACERISLSEVAHAVQVSSAYLTQAFTQSEGMPLYRYHMRLRLNRARYAADARWTEFRRRPARTSCRSETSTAYSFFRSVMPPHGHVCAQA